MADLKFDSKILVLGCADVGKAELVNVVKNASDKTAGCASHEQPESIDYRYEQFGLPLFDTENVYASEVHFETFISSNRVNHTSHLKNAYKTAEYIIVFDISNRYGCI